MFSHSADSGFFKKIGVVTEPCLNGIGSLGKIERQVKSLDSAFYLKWNRAHFGRPLRTQVDLAELESSLEQWIATQVQVERKLVQQNFKGNILISRRSCNHVTNADQ